jgi:hypothetical protein
MSTSTRGHGTWRRAIANLTDGQLQLMLVLLYLGSRAIFYFMGVRFDLRPLDTSWHILDPALLRDDLLRSVWFTPGQPPLYNLMLGAVMKLSADPAFRAGVFALLYGTASLTTCLLLYRLLRRLEVVGWLAWSATALFMLSPALVLYENIPYYMMFELLLLTLACLQCHVAIERGTWRSYFALFMVLTTLIWIRAMFQIYWLLVLVAFCMLARPDRLRTILRAAVVPVLFVLALYAKNLAVTGEFATSSWLGMSLVKHTVHQLPLEERRQLVAEGELSPLASRDITFDVPEQLPAYFARQAPTGIAVLDQPRKSTQHVNYHHLAYVAVSRDALHDALYVIEHHPRLYLRSIREAFLMFMRPAADYPYLRPNRDALEPWGRLYAHLFAGQLRYPKDPWFVREPGTIGYVVLVAYVLSVAAGLTWLVRDKLRQGAAQHITLGFIWLNVMYVSFVGNALEIGENQRFRFVVQPLLIVILAVLLTRLALARRHARPSHALGDRVSTLPA